MNHATDIERPARYGCLECRADAESVMNGRLHPDIHARYKAHLRGCPDCRRAHETLLALYRGPQPPASPTSSGQDLEFAAILRRVAEEEPTPRYQQTLLTAGVSALTIVAAALALNIFDVDLLPARLSGGLTGSALSASRGLDAQARDDLALEAGRVRIEHRAQVDYGRIIGGHANVLDAEDQVVVTNTFEVGTRFHIPSDQNLQARFIGKILSNFGSEAQVSWTAAQPDLIELELNSGIIATRYDRLLEDPVLKVRTPTAVVKVLGTVFTVEVNDAGETSVAVLRGKVEVLEPEHERVIADVSAGYRFDVASSTYSDLGRVEILAALPLSEATLAANGDVVGDEQLAQLVEHIPSSWVVPGLPSDPTKRTLDNLIPRRPARKSGSAGRPLSDEELFNTLIAPLAPVADDDGEELLFELMQRDFERTRRKELRAKLRRCGDYYQSPETRYMAARCITEFMNRHGDEADVAEGWLLYGILRMDYANDYRVAMSAFRKFLAASPHHPEAELARYRLWLASTESGQIANAELRGREYLRRYPSGKYVGKILQRFPKLVDEL
ncbi:MAG: FecR domain-containing protein [Myxococcales bacterium]|nr:FecR domain-containing protein [Myxococcales bacterium]